MRKLKFREITELVHDHTACVQHSEPRSQVCSLSLPGTVLCAYLGHRTLPGDPELVDHPSWGDGEDTVSVASSAHVSSYSEKDRFKFDFFFFFTQMWHSSRHNDEDKEKEGKHWLIFSPQASVSYCKQKNNVSARAGFMSKTQRGLFTIAERGPAPGKQLPCTGLDLSIHV